MFDLKSPLNPPFEKGGNDVGFTDGDKISISLACGADIPPIGVEGKPVGAFELE